MGAWLRGIGPLLLAGLLLRLVVAEVIVPGQGLSEDVANFNRWALTLADHGPGAFYANGGFTAYTPGYLYVLWPLGIVGRALSGMTGVAAEEIVSHLVKLPAMFADIGIGYLLYRSAKRWSGTRAGIMAAALYLFIPFTWYESAVFGQIDSVGTLAVLGSLLLLIAGWSEFAVVLAVLAIAIKPTFAVVLPILVPILLRRHLFRPGSGPIPVASDGLSRLDRRLGGLFTHRQGPERLATCAVAGLLALIVPILPFDLPFVAPDSLAGIPVIGHLAGFAALDVGLAASYHVLTADAFNIWAVIGPIPLSHELSRDFLWTFDSLPVIGSISALAIGAALFALATAMVVIVLLRRDDRIAILVGFTVVALAFFALPTRVHERYQFPIFVSGAIFAATSVRWRWWYVALGLLGAVNLHAVLTLPRPGFATAGLIGAPLGDLFRSDWVVIAVSLANTALFAALFVVWLRDFAVPAINAHSAQPAGASRSGAWGRRRASEGLLTRMSRPVRPPLEPETPSAQRRSSTGGPASAAERPSSAAEGPGRLGRRDVAMALLVVVVALGMRLYRIDQPRTMYFDELYYPSTAAEFLRDWRYGISTNIFEWTHPHVAKYIQAISVVAFGNDRVVGTSNVGAPVRDAAFEPAFPQASGGYAGDRVAIATGADVRVAPHGDLASAMVVPLPGAAAVAFDVATDRLYIGTDDGGIWALAGSSAVRVGAIDGPVQHLLVVARDRIVVRTSGDRLLLVDGTSGSTLATATQPGLAGLIRVPVGDRSLIVGTVPAGLAVIDPADLQQLAQVPLAARPAGLDFVNGSDFGWRNQDTLPEPRVYVALEGNQIQAMKVGPQGELTTADTFPMPGPVSDIRWDRPTNMVHALGRTAAGQPTLYVVEPHTDSVFADAALPFEPAAWLLDAQPDTPSLDRERALAFAGDGSVAVVDTGAHAFAWRLPGVISGAITMGLLYLLTRMLFRRRLVADLLAVVLLLDGLLFSQGRLGTNDSIMGLFIVGAVTLLAALLRTGSGGRGRLGLLLGLPAVGVLLGLALATKWVGAYAIGASVLLVLAQTQVGRRLALAGLLGLTAILGYVAIAGDPPNVTFLVLMVGITVAAGVAMLRPRSRPEARGDAEAEASRPSFVDPRRRFGIPFAWAMVCLMLVPLAVYVLTYVPWALSATGSPQLFPGWPPGHTGETFVDLQARMYAYHADLRTPHGNGSPWWAWPFGLRPFWGYFDTYSDGSQALMLMADNPVLVWLSVPAIAFGVWRAWKRRVPGLLFVVIAFAALWLPWARIDRVAYNYHYYVPMMFAFILLAYFLAEVLEGQSRHAWNLARLSFALVLVAPALMWIFKDQLCAVAGTAQVDPNSFECSRPLSDVALPLVAWLIGSVVLAAVVLRIRRPRVLVGSMLVAAGVAFVALYPALSALPIPNGWALVYQGLLPTWEVSFHFVSNTQPAVAVPLLTPGPLVVLALAVGLLWLALRAARPEGMAPLQAFAGRLAARTVAVRPRFGGSASGARVEAHQSGAPAASQRAEPSLADAPPTTGSGLPEADRTAHAHRARAAGGWFDPAALVERLGVPVGLFALAWIVYTLVNHGRSTAFEYFVPLADAFLHGKLGLDAGYSWLNEVVPGKGGLYYVVLPPAPAVLLMPSVWLLGNGLDQVRSSILLGALNVALVSVILAGMGLGRRMQIVLSLVFGFGTIVWFSAQVGTGWHFAHVVATLFMLLAILACQRDARTWLIGLLFAGAVLSRLPVLLAAPFFLAYLVDRTRRDETGDPTPYGAIEEATPEGRGERRGGDLRQSPGEWARRIRTRRFLSLAVPMAVGLGIPLLWYLAYDALRFGSPFENGYALIPGLLQEPGFQNGVFSIANVPKQLRLLLLSLPQAAPDFPFVKPLLQGGPSILLTSPILLWAFKSRRLDLFNIGAWAAVILVLIPNLTHATTGDEQFGYRFAQDAYPFLFLLAVRGLRGRISRLAWGAIAVGFAVNLWGMAAAYFGWWA